MPGSSYGSALHPAPPRPCWKPRDPGITSHIHPDARVSLGPWGGAASSLPGGWGLGARPAGRAVPYPSSQQLVSHHSHRPPVHLKGVAGPTVDERLEDLRSFPEMEEAAEHPQPTRPEDWHLRLGPRPGCNQSWAEKSPSPAHLPPGSNPGPTAGRGCFHIHHPQTSPSLLHTYCCVPLGK